jgi:hypothetical protein
LVTSVITKFVFMKAKIIFLLLLILPGLQAMRAQVYGCTDPLSRNFNPNATINDGSCTYPSTTVSAVSTIVLPDTVNETSGLLLWDASLYTHNDNTDINLYSLNSLTGNLENTVAVTGTSNQDWEDIDQDENYVYIAETGNNVSGNRSNLRILRVDKVGLLAGNPTVNSINFTYSNQSSFAATSNNSTDFDCEAIIVSRDSIYLFTKQWVSRKTSVYSLPKTPGTHIAQLQDTYNVGGLITGATYIQDKRVVALCGYSTTLQPFIYLLYDFDGDNFFGGNKRKLNLSLNFHQIEGITTVNGLDYYISNEHFQQFVINVPQKLHTVNLSEYLSSYLQNVAGVTANTLKEAGIIIFPNPAFSTLTIQCPQSIVGRQYQIVDMTGRIVQGGVLLSITNILDIASLTSGVYTVIINGFETDGYRLIKK